MNTHLSPLKAEIRAYSAFICNWEGRHCYKARRRVKACVFQAIPWVQTKLEQKCLTIFLYSNDLGQQCLCPAIFIRSMTYESLPPYYMEKVQRRIKTFNIGIEPFFQIHMFREFILIINLYCLILYSLISYSSKFCKFILVINLYLYVY